MCCGLLEANRSEFFCTYVKVLEVLFKIKCCGKGSILFFFFKGVLFFTGMCGTDEIKEFTKQVNSFLLLFFLVYLNVHSFRRR